MYSSVSFPLAKVGIFSACKRNKSHSALAAKGNPVPISITLPSNEKVTSYLSGYFPGVEQFCASGLEIENSPSLRLTACKSEIRKVNQPSAEELTNQATAQAAFTSQGIWISVFSQSSVCLPDATVSSRVWLMILNIWLGLLSVSASIMI